MAPAQLSDHLPGLLGPSRRAAWRRVVLRRGLALALLLIALQLAVTAARGPSSGDPILVAVADVPAGEVIRAEHLEVRTGGPPVEGALSSPGEIVGRRATVAIAAGEVLTDARGGGSGALADLPSGHRAVSLPLLAATEVSPGDRVDVYRGGRDEPVAQDALVVAADPPPEDGLTPVGEGAQVVVAVPSDEAGALVAALGPDTVGGFVLALRA